MVIGKLSCYLNISYWGRWKPSVMHPVSSGTALARIVAERAQCTPGDALEAGLIRGAHLGLPDAHAVRPRRLAGHRVDNLALRGRDDTSPAQAERMSHLTQPLSRRQIVVE